MDHNCLEIVAEYNVHDFYLNRGQQFCYHKELFDLGLWPVSQGVVITMFVGTGKQVSDMTS